MKPESHLFFAGHYSGRALFHHDGQARLRIIKRATAEQLQRLLSPESIAWHPLQKTVQKAAESRLRRLQKEAKPPKGAKKEGLYWRTWAAYYKAMRDSGFSNGDANGERHALTFRVLGKDKSHKSFTNAEMTMVLAAMRAITQNDDLMAQIRATPAAQEAILSRYLCAQTLEQISDIDPAEQRTAEEVNSYIDTTFTNISKCAPSDFGDDSGAWSKVIAAIKIRYDQVCRARLGLRGDKGFKRYWPHNHYRNWAEVAAHCGDIAPPPDGQYQKPEDDNEPF